MRRRFRGELAALKFSLPFTSFKVAKIGLEMLSSNISLRTRLWKAETRKRDAQVEREDADAKLGKAHRAAHYVVELKKRLAASHVSVQGLTAELTTVKAQLVQVTADKLELSTKLDPVMAESDKGLKEWADVHCARDRIDGLVGSIVGLSVQAREAFVNQTGTQLVDFFHTGLENA